MKVTFLAFAKDYVSNSGRKESTKDNIATTIKVLQGFRGGMDFKDITYSFLKEFEQYLRERGNGINTIAKHMKQLRMLVNEAINQGYIHADAYLSGNTRSSRKKGNTNSSPPTS